MANVGALLKIGQGNCLFGTVRANPGVCEDLEREWGADLKRKSGILTSYGKTQNCIYDELYIIVMSLEQLRHLSDSMCCLELQKPAGAIAESKVMVVQQPNILAGV